MPWPGLRQPDRTTRATSSSTPSAPATGAGWIEESMVPGSPVPLYRDTFPPVTGEPGTIDSSIHPTPVAGVLGVLDDVARVVRSGWRSPGQGIYLLGSTRGERDGLVEAAHDLSEGGLAQGLVEGCLRYGVGAAVDLAALGERDGVTPFEALFAKSSARALVAVPRSEAVRLVDLCTARGVPALRIGVTDDTAGDTGTALHVADLFTVGLTELTGAHTATLPDHFG